MPVTDEKTGVEFDLTPDVDPLDGIPDEDIIRSLEKRYPQQIQAARAQVKPEEKPEIKPEVKPEPVVLDPADEVDSRTYWRETLMAQADTINGLTAEDKATLKGWLRAKELDAKALERLHKNGGFELQAKGLAYNRLQTGESRPSQTPAGVTPGGHEGGLTAKEKAEIKRLAPRMNVSEEDLTAQYIARKKQ